MPLAEAGVQNALHEKREREWRQSMADMAVAGTESDSDGDSASSGASSAGSSASDASEVEIVVEDASYTGMHCEKDIFKLIKVS